MYNPKLDEGCDLKIVGVGGAGSSTVSYMLSREIAGAQFIVMNTDAASLEANPCSNKMLLGHGNLEKEPLLGRQSVLESHDDIVDAICDARLLILVAGMGGNTATSALPLIAQMAKDMDIFVVCMVIMPFAFEDKRRRERAQEGVASLEKVADNVIVFPNEHFLRGLPKNASLADGYEIAKDIMFKGARYISGLLDTNTIDMDDEDFQYIQHYIKTHDFLCKNNVEDAKKESDIHKEPDVHIAKKTVPMKDSRPHICRENLGHGCVCQVCGTVCHTLEDDDNGFGTGLVYRWCTRCNTGEHFYGDTGTTVSGSLWPDGYDHHKEEWTRADYLRAIENKDG